MLLYDHKITVLGLSLSVGINTGMQVHKDDGSQMRRKEHPEFHSSILSNLNKNV